MNPDCVFHSLKLILVFIALVLLGWVLAGCGSLVRVEYQNPRFGGGAVEVTLPAKQGYAK